MHDRKVVLKEVLVDQTFDDMQTLMWLSLCTSMIVSCILHDIRYMQVVVKETGMENHSANL